MAPEACTPNVCRRASALTDVRLWEGRGGGGGAAGVAAGAFAKFHYLGSSSSQARLLVAGWQARDPSLLSARDR